MTALDGLSIRALGEIPADVSSEVGLADAPHFVILGDVPSGARWSFFTADLAVGSMLETAITEGTKGERIEFNHRLLPWMRIGWPNPVARVFDLPDTV